MPLVISLLAAVTLVTQGPEVGAPRVVPPPSAAAPRATATLAARPPVIDGRDADDVWPQATPITEFREWQPHALGPAPFPTMRKAAYEARTLYVLVHRFTP